MKLEICLLVILMLPVCADAVEPDSSSFNGKWVDVELAKDGGKPISNISLTLNVHKNGSLHGSYCFVTQSGNRIDCDPDGEFNIKGMIVHSSNTAQVNFHSF